MEFFQSTPFREHIPNGFRCVNPRLPTCYQTHLFRIRLNYRHIHRTQFPRVYFNLNLNIALRNNLIEEFLQMADLNNMDYEHRELLYDLLNRPNWNAEDISKKLGFNETIVSRMIDEILQYCREMER